MRHFGKTQPLVAGSRSRAFHATRALRKSDGTDVTCTEWRANALADRLAKRGAFDDPIAKATQERIEGGAEAALAAAAQLAVVTLAANQHPTIMRRADGTEVTVLKRDAVGPPARPKRAKTPEEPAAIASLAPLPTELEPRATDATRSAAKSRRKKREVRRPTPQMMTVLGSSRAAPPRMDEMHAKVQADRFLRTIAYDDMVEEAAIRDAQLYDPHSPAPQPQASTEPAVCASNADDGAPALSFADFEEAVMRPTPRRAAYRGGQVDHQAATSTARGFFRSADERRFASAVGRLLGAPAVGSSTCTAPQRGV